MGVRLKTEVEENSMIHICRADLLEFAKWAKVDWNCHNNAMGVNDAVAAKEICFF